jgi:hypothetical protein
MSWLIFSDVVSIVIIVHRCCPSFVSRSHLVTTRAIDQNLWTYVPLGQMNSQTKFQSNLILGLATRWLNPKT